MYLKKLAFKGFRNLEDSEVLFKNNSTVLVGDNAQGKTNILESIYFIATGRPIKTDTDEEVIKFGESSVNVEGQVLGKSDEEVKLTTIIHKTELGLRKKLLVNDISRRVIDYTGNLVVVFFRPEDIELITGSPSIRREYIDATIGQIDRDYRKILSSYQKAVTQKNKLLKLIREGISRKDELDFWNDQQLLLGRSLQNKRRDFFEKVNSFEKKFGDFEYIYLPNLISESRLDEVKEKEILAAVSLVGPHRDDFQFFEKDQKGATKDLAKYGSRGEQRTAVLDLKITELSFFEEILNVRPILFLDDIFSELDEGHRQHVLDLSRLQQTIIASVEYDEYLKSALEKSQILKVKKGVIS